VAVAHEYPEEIKGHIRCQDGFEFFVIARAGQGWLMKGIVYVFLQDVVCNEVFQIYDIDDKNGQTYPVLTLQNEKGLRAEWTIVEMKQTKGNNVRTYLKMAWDMAKAAKTTAKEMPPNLGLFPTWGSHFQWAEADIASLAPEDFSN
jgi:hypothetical protein